jgi:hypothetical protein
MERNIRKYGYNLEREKVADSIKDLVNKIEKYINRDFCNNEFEKHYKKWGETQYILCPCKGEPNYSTLEFKHKNVNTEKEKEQEEKEFRDLCEKEEKIKEQQKKEIFDYFCKHLEEWWD